MAKKRVKTIVSALHDSFQAVHGSQVMSSDFLPAVEAAVAAGVKHFEVGGRYQSLHFTDNEDPFVQMDEFKKTVGSSATLQSTARCTNVIGSHSQTSDVVELHARLMKKHGVSTVRNLDPLNDADNFAYSAKCLHRAGLKHEVSISMMSVPSTSPHVAPKEVYGSAFYEILLRRIVDEDIPFDSIAFMDAFGTSQPKVINETIKKARKMLPYGTPITFQTNNTAGVSTLSYLAALDGGADTIVLCLGPAPGGTSRPDISTMSYALEDTEFSLDMDIEKLREAERSFTECAERSLKTANPRGNGAPAGMPPGEVSPGNPVMLESDVLNKYAYLLKAMREVVEYGGYATSLAPISQYYFRQALNNTKFGPWEKIDEDYGKLVLGFFGRTPVKPDATIVTMAAQQLKLRPPNLSILERNDSDPEKGLNAAKRKLQAAGLEQTEENAFIVATAPQSGIAFLKKKRGKK